MNDTNDTAKSGLKGVVNEVAGTAKEVVGDVVGNHGLREEGRAQQDKAEHERNVAEHEAKAAKERAEARADEARQDAASEHR